MIGKKDATTTGAASTTQVTAADTTYQDVTAHGQAHSGSQTTTGSEEIYLLSIAILALNAVETNVCYIY